jgi:hypothetical protein
VIKKILSWGLLAFLIYYIVTQPDNAAGIFRALGGGLKNIAVGLGHFVGSLH